MSELVDRVTRLEACFEFLQRDLDRVAKAQEQLVLDGKKTSRSMLGLAFSACGVMALEILRLIVN